MEEQVYHANYYIENAYWWFLGRNKVVSKIIENKCDLNAGGGIIDVGCGTGGLTEILTKRYKNVTGIDTSPVALGYCRRRGLTNLFLGNLGDYPDNPKVMAITMFEVIEHIENDTEVVRNACSLLEDGGWLIATVPAYMWLWSPHDVIHMHKRRYRKKQFEALIRRTDLKIEYSSYFNTFLLLPAIIKKVIDKIIYRNPENAPSVDIVPKPINWILKWIFKFESLFLPKFRFPFGMSIIVIARKNK